MQNSYSNIWDPVASFFGYYSLTYPEIFLRIPFSAGDFGEGVQKDIIVVTVDEQFSVINMYGWYGQGLFTMENVIIMYLSIVLEIVLGKGSFKITLRFLVLCLA